jgi:predicted nucleotidyltransferase
MTSLDTQTRSQIVAQVLEAREKRAEFLEQMRQRQQRGWEVARQCARILKEQFGAQRVVLFGSLLEPQRMTWHSDLDLAVWGLPERDYFRAVATLIDVEPEFRVDLVEGQRVQPHILKAIAQGIEL